MIILTIRTDKPEAEIGLFEDDVQLSYETWQANRELAETIHSKIHALLAAQHKELGDLTGIIVFSGPGSFTGLRIGITVANALAFALGIAITGATGDQWIEQGRNDLLAGKNRQSVVPDYGAPVHITPPKH